MRRAIREHAKTIVAVMIVVVLIVIAAALGTAGPVSRRVVRHTDQPSPVWVAPDLDPTSFSSWTGPPLVGVPVRYLQPAPAILEGAPLAHEPRGPCVNCHAIKPRPRAATATTAWRQPAPPRDRLAESAVDRGQAGGRWLGQDKSQGARRWPAPAARARWSRSRRPVEAARGKKLPWQEAHWQGIEVVPLTPQLARVLGVRAGVEGVVIDDVTWPADSLGFRAGDIVTGIEMVSTPSLESFVRATEAVRDRHEVSVRILRGDEPRSLRLSAARRWLGIAAGETAPMIPSGSRAPHGYLGPCTSCHRIGTTGQLAADPGDQLTKSAPPIRWGAHPPHRDRGRCTACHVIR